MKSVGQYFPKLASFLTFDAKERAEPEKPKSRKKVMKLSLYKLRTQN